MTKIFESNTNTGFKYRFVPFACLSIALVILTIVHMYYKEVYPLNRTIILSVIGGTLLLELFLYKALQKTNNIKLYSTINGLLVSIKNDKITLEQKVSRINYWWS